MPEQTATVIGVPPGLTTPEAAARLATYGPNALAVERRPVAVRLLLRQLTRLPNELVRTSFRQVGMG